MSLRPIPDSRHSTLDYQPISPASTVTGSTMRVRGSSPFTDLTLCCGGRKQLVLQLRELVDLKFVCGS